MLWGCDIILHVGRYRHWRQKHINSLGLAAVTRACLVPGCHRTPHPEVISVSPWVPAWAGAGSPWLRAKNAHVDSGWASSRSSRSEHKALKHSSLPDLLLKRKWRVYMKVFKKSYNISSWLDVYLVRISKRKLVQWFAKRRRQQSYFISWRNLSIHRALICLLKI